MQVTTTTGETITFDPAQVFMITGQLPSDNTPVCYIHGVTPAPFPRVADAIAVFVATMPNAAHFVPLHLWNTNAVFYVNSLAVHSVQTVPANQKASHQNANAVIMLGGKHRYITETVAVAIAAIQAAGGSL